MSSTALRPGIAHGTYPERDVERTNAVERAVQGLVGAVGRRRGSSPSHLAAFVRSVEACGSDLRQISQDGFEARVRELRQRLGVGGITDELIPPAFALVREASRRALGMAHYRVQLVGGWVLARGMLAEMETGEGKTLTATLPACTAALAGIPVHVVSANDYLVERDAESMRPIYEAMGLSVGAVCDREKDVSLRRAAYACDITYGTAQQIAFDYLRDGLERGKHRGRLPMQLERLYQDTPSSGRLLLRGLCFAIIDEVDSVLIDEARTPLILSVSGSGSEQRRIYRTAMRLARALESGIHFRVGGQGQVDLTDAGHERLEELARPLKGFWTGPKRREEWVGKALSALHVFVRDQHYLVREDKVQIIDQSTGRISPDRSWQGGIHQLIELKEDCELTPEKETLARISYQQFFRRYLRLAGMTGTASEVAPELWSSYRLNTVVVPTRKQVVRRHAGTRVFAGDEARWKAVVRNVRDCHRRGQPVLVGTASVGASEHLSRLLGQAGLPHQVLNARHDAEEASIVADAGALGRITVATNMAGRGTDIALAPGVLSRGGLHVISTQRSDARRIDRQLFGRCARQGDPGSYECVYSLEDEPVARFFPAGLLRSLAAFAKANRALATWLGELLTSLPQRAEERRHVRMRRSVVDLEEYLGDLLAFSGPTE